MASGDKFYIADKATMDEVKGKIGSTTDTGGSSTAGTVMAKENAILEEVGKIGATNDAQSSSTTTGSIFAKINYLVSQVSAYLSTLYSRIGTPTDSANNSTGANAHQKLNWFLNIFGATNDTQSSSTTTGSVFAKLNYLVSQVSIYLSNIYNNCLKIGTTTDTGGTATTGTVFAKLNNLIAQDKHKVFKYLKTSFFGTNQTDVTVLSATGAGEFYMSQVVKVSNIKVIIDGIQFSCDLTPNGDYIIKPSFMYGGEGLCAVVPNDFYATISSMPFKNSLIVKLSSGSTYSAQAKIAYALYE